MFTGIVTAVGCIRAAERAAGGDLRVTIETGWPAGAVAVGASVACSGVCLTAVRAAAGEIAVDVSDETLRRTAPGMWTAGRRINLEPSLRVGDELGGHIVTGHVDGVGTVEAAERTAGSLALVVLAPPSLAPLLAEKGSLAVDGVSLTVNRVCDTPAGPRVHLNIIPHTAAVTTLGALAPGDAVNLEADILARYLARMLALRDNIAV